jgi:hypothetical protein
LDLVYPWFVLALLTPCKGSASHALEVHILGSQAQKHMSTMACQIHATQKCQSVNTFDAFESLEGFEQTYSNQSAKSV